MRIVLDLSKPLSRGRLLKLKEKSNWVAFQYEKIPKFCLNYGVIRHGSKGCEKVGTRRFQGTEKEPQFGTWLRAMSLKRRYGNGGTWDRRVKRRPMSDECSHQMGSEKGEDDSGFAGKYGGRNMASSPRSPNEGDGIFGSRAQLRCPNKESVDSAHMEMEGNDLCPVRNSGEKITGKPILGSRSPSGDSG